MAMLAQQMQLANAMMPGAPLQPVVSNFSVLIYYVGNSKCSVLVLK